ncbi:unnamed protein product [Mortierella alpina]
MSDPPFPVRLGIVALKATALWVNTMLTFLQDEFPHPEDVRQNSEEQSQEQEQGQQNLLDDEPHRNQSAVASASASGEHFSEENYRRQLLSILTGQLAVESGMGSLSSSSATWELLREQLNNTGEDNENHHDHSHQSAQPNDNVDRALQTDENTVVNEMAEVASRLRTEEATLTGAINILLALNRQRRPNEQDRSVGNEKYNEQRSLGDQDERNEQSQHSQQREQSERSEEYGQDEAQEDSSPMITRRVTRGAVAMRNRMELESLQGAMNSAAAAEALEAARTRGQNADNLHGISDKETRASLPSVVIPKALKFDHISTPEWPNGDVVYRFKDRKELHQNTWVWSNYSGPKGKGSTSSHKVCMGVNQCPKCGYAQKPRISHRKKVPGGIPHAPAAPRTACKWDGTPLVHVGCSARLKLVHANGIFEITHSNTHNHGKPQETTVAKRTYDEMEGLENEKQSAEQETARSAAKESTQPRRTVRKSSRPQPSVLIDNRPSHYVQSRFLPYGIHVDRTTGYGKWTICSFCDERIERRNLRVVHKIKDSTQSCCYRMMYYHTTCLSHLPKNMYREVQDKLKDFRDD